MKIEEIKAKIKAHYGNYKHLCYMRLEGNKVFIRHKRTQAIYKWVNGETYLKIPTNMSYEIQKYISELK